MSPGDPTTGTVPALCSQFLLMCLHGRFERRASRRQQLAELTLSPTVVPALGEAAP